MTDQELIRLLHEKPAGEFTPVEMDALRVQWTQSPELRQALVEHLHLESQLAGALGRVELDVDLILQRAASQRPTLEGPPASPWRWAFGICLLLSVLLGGSLWFGGERNRIEVVQRAEPEPDSVAPLPRDEAADAIWPANVPREKSAEAAVARANGEEPEKPTSPPPVPVVPPAVVDAVPVIEPWTAALSRGVAPWPAHSPKLTRDFKTAGHDDLPEVEAKRWFASVEGQPYTWAQDVYGQQHKRVARFQGLARLRAPWTDDTLLRMTPLEVTDFTLYLWRGPQGLALRFYTRREPHLWAAFTITRENSSPKPLHSGLLTTDNGSYTRAGAGTFDLRYQDGGITLARGGVPLLTAPLAAPPDEVYVEGQFRLRGVSLHKSAPLPSLPENPHPIAFGGGAMAELPWSVSAELPAGVVSNADGSVTMTTDSATKQGIVTLPFSQHGLYEVIARVHSADPGTGLFLGDTDGRPLHRIGYFRDAATQQITLGVLRPGELRDTSQFDPNAFPPPYHAPQQWVKIVAGLGTLQILVSGDGRHWGHLVENPARDLIGPVASVGLYGLPGPAPRSLRLSQLEVRELTGITSLAENRLVNLSPQFAVGELKETEKWTHRALATQPAGVELPRWLNACAVAALSQGPAKELGVPLLKRLVGIGILSEVALGSKLLLLDDAALLCDLWDEASARTIGLHYEDLAAQLTSSGDPQPLATLRPAILRSSMWTVSKLRFAWERQNSREVLLSAYRGDWAEAWQASQTALFWNTGVHPDWKPTERSDELDKFARWVKAIAVENQPQLDDGSAGVFPSGWRHPLAMQWNKEAYNVRSELQSALIGQTYEDASRIVMSIGEQDGPGLLPDMDDRQLFVSLPTAVAGAMQTHPGFAKLMIEQFGPLGVIRVRKAINDNDVRGVQGATLQFYGTEAAAEAHQWLGDRALSAGRFPAAEEHFLLALDHATPRQRESLTPRLQLARTLNGQPATAPVTPPTEPIVLSGTSIAPAAFESLIRDLAARPSPASRFTSTTPVVVTPPLAPAHFKLEPRAGFDGQPGNNPGRAEFRFGDPFGRQLAVVTDAQRMYVSNRFQVNAYALPGGQQVWAQGLGAEQGEAHGLPFLPMKPLVAADRLYVRRLSKGGAELTCLQSENGTVLWKQRPNLQVLSDPVFWNGSLFALTLARVEDELLQVEGTRFDLETGAATSSQPLFRLKDSGDRGAVAQLSLAGRVAVCTVGGTTACFDSAGEVHWLRRHVWLPKPVDELADDFRVLPPVVLDDRVVVSMPGVRAINCLQLATGRRLWERPLAELHGVVTVGGSRVVVETASGLTALSLDDGTVAWTKRFDARLEAFHTDGQTLVVTQRGTAVGTKSRPQLLWLELATGRELAQSQLAGVDRDEPQLGPLLFAAGKWWTFAATGWKDPKRELNELVVASPLIPGAFASHVLGPWQPDFSETQQADFALILPGWFPAASFSTASKPMVIDARGETFVLASKLIENQELTLIGEFDIPAGRKTSLRLRVGNQPERRWLLRVRVDGEWLLERLIEEAGSANGWHDLSLDLTPFAGRTVPIQLHHSASKPSPTEVLWKRATVVSE